MVSGSYGTTHSATRILSILFLFRLSTPSSPLALAADGPPWTYFTEKKCTPSILPQLYPQHRPTHLIDVPFLLSLELDRMRRRRFIARALHLTCPHFLEHPITSLFSSQQSSQWSALLIGCNSSTDLSLLQPGFAPTWLDECQFWSLINTSSLQHLTQWTPPFMTIFFLLIFRTSHLPVSLQTPLAHFFLPLLRDVSHFLRLFTFNCPCA